MNETIGVKGGKNDRRRVFKITRKQLQKIKEQEELTKKNITTKFTIISPQQKEKEKIVNKRVIENTSLQAAIIVEQNNIPIKEANISKKLDNIKNKEIISYYENKLKEIKIDLKEIIYEYNIIVSETEELYESKQAKYLLDKLNIVISNIEKLKKMIDVPNTEDYDQNYIYTLISEYLDEFEKNNLLASVKDSDLYILISSKLTEISSKKDLLLNTLEDKKNKISLDEEQLEEMKSKYDTFDNFNNTLLRFQADQEYIIKDLEDKIKNSTSIEEKVEIKFKILDSQLKTISTLIAPQLLIPGAKSGVRMAVATASLVFVLRRHIRPKMETTRYRVVNVTDYSKDISNSIIDIEKSLNLLKNSKKQLEKFLIEFKDKYKDYLGKIKACDNLVNNLDNLLISLKEKEEELEIMKKRQEKNLENNNIKVNVLQRDKIA